MTRLYFDISFPLAMPRDVLSYHRDVADDDPLPQPGCRVVAGIQGRQVIGYIIRVHQQKPEFVTHALIDILDYWPLMSPALVELAAWIARQYVCSPGEAFHAMLPAGIKQKISRIALPTEKSRLMQESQQELPNAVAWLVTEGATPVNRLFQTFPGVSRRLAQWISDGLVEILHQRSEAAGPKLNRVLYLPIDRPLQLEELTPKERIVVEFLLKRNAALSAADLRKQTGVSAAPIEQLLKKGVLAMRHDRVLREVATEEYYCRAPTPIPLLTTHQDAALKLIRQADATHKKPQLIFGVTCSGKTEVYLRWVAEQLENKRGVIVLVPEISLTPQMTKRFRDRFGERVAILHSKLSDGERFDQWEQIRLGTCPLVVGARSAIFAPVRNLGTVIIDEEGEPTFKQSETPRYHAREVARKRCELENALLVMGSATPTMETYKNSIEGSYSLISMPERVSDRRPPEVQIVDMRHELVAKKNRSMFSQLLSRSVFETLESKKQVILYLNRRGYSSFVLCRACGKTVECSRCGISLVYHAGSKILRCHYCGEAKPIPRQCGVCASQAIKFFGAGTQRIEDEARRYFPQARIQRLDSDTVAASGALEEILDAFGNRKIDMLIGTQMVAKGLDFPDVTLIGIMAADGLLRLPDFRASERNFMLLAQVAGRAGRGDSPGKVVLQTYFPEHHSIRYALTEDYQGFYAEETTQRREAFFPPFSHIAMILLTSEKPEKARAAGTALRERILQIPGVTESGVMGPAPAPLERINNQYRFQILLKFPPELSLFESLKATLGGFSASGVKITVDVDPYFCL
jgi:primosomal protein N' (replication factor Y)